MLYLHVPSGRADQVLRTSVLDGGLKGQILYKFVATENIILSYLLLTSYVIFLSVRLLMCYSCPGTRDSLHLFTTRWRHWST